MRRSARRLERAVATAVRKAEWLDESHTPAVLVAKALARKIDDQIHLAELEAQSRPTLFMDVPLAPLTAGTSRKSSGSSSLTYDLDVLTRMLDGLGITPRGRRELGRSDEGGDEDELASVLRLHAGR